jgi:hypothetical protein
MQGAPTVAEFAAIRAPNERPGVPRPILGPAIAGAIGLGTCVAFGIVNPEGGPTICPFRAATGLYCPGCGATRMMHQLMIGDVGRAVRLNPLAFLFVPLMAWWSFAGLTAMLGGPRLATPRFTARQTWLLAGVVLAFWILRNVPVFPFRLMGPL